VTLNKRYWRHKRIAMIAVSINRPGDPTALARVNRYSTFTLPLAMDHIHEHFDECTKEQYDAAFDNFPDRREGSWEVDIATGFERRVTS